MPCALEPDVHSDAENTTSLAESCAILRIARMSAFPWTLGDDASAITLRREVALTSVALESTLPTRHVEVSRPRDCSPRSTRQVDANDELASTNAGGLKIDLCSL
jgi:hypothetical protein